MYRGVFLDRDGVINKSRPYFPHGGEGDIRNYVTKWEDWEWADGAIEGLKLLAETDYKLIVVSNQACVGYGLMTLDAMIEIFDTAAEKIQNLVCGNSLLNFPEKVAIDLMFACPHHPKDNCACRKPKPGLLYQAAIVRDIVLEDSWMIGDSWTDLRAGCFAKIPANKLLKIGGVEPNPPMWWGSQTPICSNLLEAAELIVEAG